MFYVIQTKQDGKIKVTTGFAINSYRRALGVRTLAAAEARRAEVNEAGYPAVIAEFENDAAALDYCGSYN